MLSILGIVIMLTPVAGAAPLITLDPTSGTMKAAVTVTGSGFTPGGSVAIDFGTVYITTAQADDSGNINTAFNVPVIASGSYPVVASDSGDAGSASATFTVIQSLSLSISPKQGTSGTRVTLKGTGFTPSGTVRIPLFENELTTTASDLGEISISFSFPSVQPGDYTINVIDAQTEGFATASFTLIKSSETTPPPSTSSPAPTAVATEIPGTTAPEPTPTSSSALPTTTPIITTRSFTLNPTEAKAGTGIVVTGSGFTPGGSVIINLDSTTVATVTADGFGHVSTIFTLPDLSVGSHLVTLLDSTTYDTTTETLTVSKNSSAAGFWSPTIIAALLAIVLATTIPLTLIAVRRRGHKKPIRPKDEKSSPTMPVFQQPLPPRPLPPPPPWLLPADQTYETEYTDTCLFCGAPLLENEKICRNCGERN